MLRVKVKNMSINNIINDINMEDIMVLEWMLHGIQNTKTHNIIITIHR